MDVIHIPILSIHFLTPITDFDLYDGIIVTSKEAAVALKFYTPDWNTLKVICVGESTAKAMSVSPVLSASRPLTLPVLAEKILKAGYIRTEKSYYWDTESYLDGGKFSPNGRYMVSKKGYITDLQEGKVIKNVFVVDFRTGPFKYGPRPFDISFNPEETTCTVSIHEKGLCTYNLSTGALISTVPIPTQVLYSELVDIFEIIQLPNNKDFIYWLNFKNKTAPMSLAFYVKDSIPLPLCDPDWEKESITNYLVLLSQKNEQEAKARAAANKRRLEEKAYRLAHPNEKPREVYRKPELRLVQQPCGYCDGTGSIAFEKFIIGGKRETTVTTGLYGKRTYNTTGGTGSATCSACKGKKYIGVCKEYTPKD